MAKKLRVVFMKKNYKRLIKEKGSKLFVKWKGYDHSFNSWINKKDIV